MSNTIEQLIQRIRAVHTARDWGQFHSPKNLAINLSVEVGELLEHFTWLTEEQSKSPNQVTLNEIKDEIGDVLICLLTLADKLNIDIVSSADQKLDKVEKKYPVEKCKGKCLKHTHYN